MRNRKRIAIASILIMLIFILTGCDDDFYDDYDYYDNHDCYDHCDEYDDYDYYDEYYYDECYDDDYEYDYEGYEIEIPENTNLKVFDYPLGTCGEMEGTTLLVSIFLNDSVSSWAGKESVIEDAIKYTGIATDWISKSASSYGCNCNFIYDWKTYSDLYYEGSVDANMLDTKDNPDYVNETGWKFIDENIDSKALLEKYNADNIGYMFYFNTPKSNNLTSCTRNYYEDMVYPYEMCYIYMFCEGEEEAPAGIAHEILHTFGAPDLYLADTDGENYGVSKQLVDELERTRSNDIMFTTYDAKNYTPYYDKITNDFTEVDAYYVGIIDSCDFVSEWNLKPSQHN
ncbi:MAG: hypothetical protein Q4E51_10205 [Lachnospiraceae bacterium]|nr:hypothetical protein [Lachnospiraceae bacterium]